MKHKILSIICCAFMVVGISGTVFGIEFVHPGISHNQAELAFVKSKLKAQEQPWQEAWDRMQSSKEAALSWQTRAVAHVERGAYNRPDIGGSFFTGGGKAAYHNRMGMDMPWCQKAIEKNRPETGGTMPWSTLMYADQPAGLVKLAARVKDQD